MIYDVILGLICFALGFIFACYRVVNKYYSGEMEINHFDPMKDTYKMHINDFDKMDKSKYVLFKVKHTQK